MLLASGALEVEVVGSALEVEVVGSALEVEVEVAVHAWFSPAPQTGFVDFNGNYYLEFVQLASMGAQA